MGWGLGEACGERCVSPNKRGDREEAGRVYLSTFPLSNSSANPILRRLTGVEGENDISMGAVTGSPEHVEDELIKLLAKIYIKETGYLRLVLSFT